MNQTDMRALALDSLKTSEIQLCIDVHLFINRNVRNEFRNKIFLYIYIENDARISEIDWVCVLPKHASN